jgi:hypothetical protein
MGEHNRVLSGGVLRGHRVTFFDRHLGAKRMLGTVLGVQAVDPLLDGVGQLFVSHHRAGPRLDFGNGIRILGGISQADVAQFAPMAGVKISTLIECWRNDCRMMAGDTDAVCPAASHVGVRQMCWPLSARQGHPFIGAREP